MKYNVGSKVGKYQIEILAELGRMKPSPDSKNTVMYYRFKCDCGKEDCDGTFIATIPYVRSGKKRFCTSCLTTKRGRKLKRFNPGDIVGPYNIRVIEDKGIVTKEVRDDTYKTHLVTVACLDCDSPHDVTPSHLKRGIAVSCFECHKDNVRNGVYHNEYS